jgi:hypothetical protein
MKPEDAEEYTQSLGQIVSGSWRQIALAKRLDVPKALGLSVDQWVNGRLGGYIKQSITERREAVKELTADGHSNREIGQILGVDHQTINNDLRGENSPLPSKESSDSNGADESIGEFSPLDAVAVLAANEKIRHAVEAKEKQADKERTKEQLLKREPAAKQADEAGCIRLADISEDWDETKLIMIVSRIMGSAMDAPGAPGPSEGLIHEFRFWISRLEQGIENAAD